MCGICGIVDLDNSPPAKGADLAAMCEMIEHRGPDGTRTMIRDLVAFGHTRLSVIDTDTGWQPIANEDESIFVILNGEIYNFQGLRRELESAGHSFKTASDTEVIVHLYEEYRFDFVDHLDGMFALAVWDEPHQRLILARDRIGKKPLYYSGTNRRLVFASETKSLLKSPLSSKTVNPIALTSYLTYGYVADPLSIYDRIKKLPPGHILIFDNDGCRTRQYWRLNPDEDTSITVEEADHETRRLTDIAVSKRLISDVPLGFFLSGGVDSSIVVAAAAQSSSNRLKTFSIGFEEDSYNELPYARTIAAKFDTDHEEFVVTADLISDLETIVGAADEPFADSSMIPMYYLSRQTRNHVTVALSGDGGDEVFGGYDRYFGISLANRYHRIPERIRKNLIAPIARNIPEKPGKRSNLRRIKRLTYPATAASTQWYLGWMQQFRTDSHDAAFTSDFRNRAVEAGGWSDHMLMAFDRFEQPPTPTTAQWVDATTYLPGDLMVKADRMSMAHGLEVRSPFLDHRLVEFASRIPVSYTRRGRFGKQVLKRAYSDLVPSEITERPKAGFTVPVAEWINGPLKKQTEQLLLSSNSEVSKVVQKSYISSMLDQHASFKHDHSVRLWNLICLETWTQSLGISLG